MSPNEEQPDARSGAGTAERLAAEIEAQLRAAANPERAVQEKRYLKTELECLGVGVPAMRAIARGFVRSQPHLSHETFIALVDAVWSRAIHDLRMIAVELLDGSEATLEPADMLLIERLLRESGTWALVDNLAANVAGGLVVRFPELNQTLDRWSVDGDFWIRRSSLLALLEPLRRGNGDFERFGRYAGAMLEEKEFFIRKAIGWILREVGKKRPELVYAWLAPRAARASGVTVAEAVKYLPEEQRRKILASYHGRRAASLY